MKKTEKIELRVDYAEKERLTEIAERRGHTVSDVVRDALAGELGVAQSDYPKWPGRLAIGAALLSVLSLCLLLTDITGGGSESGIRPLYPTSVSADVYTTGENLSVDIPMLTSSQRDLTLLTEQGKTIRLSLKAAPDAETNILTIDSDGCIVRGNDCEAFDLQTMTINMRPAQTALVSLEKTLDSESFSIKFSATTYWPKLKTAQ
ncbi:MAG: ribbon-helix-helix protein, CopG family [Litorimonas sp.]